jgi:hypothetical protein
MEPRETGGPEFGSVDPRYPQRLHAHRHREPDPACLRVPGGPPIWLIKEEKNLVRLEGLEPPTRGLGNRCSVHLSYRRMRPHSGIFKPKEDMGEAQDRVRNDAIPRLAPVLLPCGQRVASGSGSGT